ncbi:AraC family transcriptional regulator [Serratia fonticola]|uniref:AraC family transcriptional regulator n=1 Tax=Serratia fonticola TaxID=47917 RepID=UPI001646D767|nr:helix-turn-helix transcriptional regulator [Serratia fonticola]MBC3231470.1 helix-turn-helix transcriptional regulator [Serratia fonticola]
MMKLHSERLLHAKKHLTPWHQHQQGQVYLLTHGMMMLETAGQQWAMTAGNLGWLPPHCPHQALACGKVIGWILYLPETCCNTLAATPRLTAANALSSALVERIAQFSAPLDMAQQRLVEVLLDEMRSEEAEPLQLPLPQDARLLRIAYGLLNDPDNDRQQGEWAAWAGLSPRTLSRRFMQETGMSFSRWRQQARVIRSLEALSAGMPVANVANECGYENVSAYIAAFRQRFGITPGLYFT